MICLLLIFFGVIVIFLPLCLMHFCNSSYTMAHVDSCLCIAFYIRSQPMNNILKLVMENGWPTLGVTAGMLHSKYLVNYLLYFCSSIWTALNIDVKPNTSAV